MTRRDAIKLFGGGAAMVGLGGIGRALAAGPAGPAGAITQPFALPALAYGYGDLEPHVDALTMEIHYTKHHRAYIANANKALEGHTELAAMTAQDILQSLASIDEPLRTALRNNVGGHANHCFWWSILSPKGGGEPIGDLAAAIAADFGSFDAFKAKLSAAAMGRFGSGWAWLSRKGQKLVVHSTANQDSPISDGTVPIVGIDVWEHAYYLKHQNRRAEYVDAFWTVVDWTQAGRNFAASAA